MDAAGHRAYVANSGSNSVSVIDLDSRREIAVAGTGEQPGLVRVSSDMRSLVVTNRGSGSVSIFALEPYAGRAGHGISGLLPRPKHAAAESGAPAAGGCFPDAPVRPTR